MLRLVLTLFAGLLLSCSGHATETVVVQPCRTAGAVSFPIATECAAAAVAETAFLEETRHRYTTYMITAIAAEHTPSTWTFLIVLGDKENPPPPGGHYLISVDRATGKTEVTPGA